MGMSFDLTTVLLLFAPLFLPRLFPLIGRLIGILSHKPQSPASQHGNPAQRERKTFKISTRLVPAIVVALWSAYCLLYGVPFSFFTSLGPFPITTPASKIQAALAWRKLADRYGSDLELLTSLDQRLRYVHFGHETFTGCHALLGSASSQDLLAYSSIRLAREYVFRALVLALSNRRWKNSILLVSLGGLLYEIYSLAATDMRLPLNDAVTSTLADWLHFSRNLGFLLLSLLTLVLPSNQSEKALSAEEAALIQGVQVLIQRQDMLQTRIRILEAAKDFTAGGSSPQNTTSRLSADQKEGLKAFIRGIVDSSDSLPPGSIPSTSADVPLVRIQAAEVDKVETGQEASDRASAGILGLPHSQSISFTEDSFATAQPVSAASSTEESLFSPSLSRSSSYSSPIDTPTPAMRRPTSMDLTAAASQIGEFLPAESTDDDGEEDILVTKRMSFDQCRARLTQSLGPSGAKSHPNTVAEFEGSIDEEKAHRRSFSINGALPIPRASPRASPSVFEDAVSTQQESALAEVEAHVQAAVNISPDLASNLSEVETFSVSVEPQLLYQDSDLEIRLPCEPVTNAPPEATFSDYTPAVRHFDEDGWTMVTSKKGKVKTQ